VHLYYETSGTGEPLLFIHGLGSSTRDWEPQVAEFSSSHHVVTFDLRGHGRSDKPRGPYRIATFAADAAMVLQALGIGPAHIVGLSLGGCVAFQLALDTPRAVKTLTIVNSAPEFVPRDLRSKLALWQRLAIVRLLGMRQMGKVLSKRLFIKPEQEALRRTFVERWAQNDRRAYLEALRAMIGWSIAARLGEIRCPTLIVAADQDYTPVALKEAYAARLPDAQLTIIPDSRHATPMEKPEQLNRVLREFLARDT
jgi:pimeloyl-ACP methyl ester carboxylesterase